MIKNPPWPQTQILQEQFFAALHPGILQFYGFSDWPSMADYNRIGREMVNAPMSLPEFAEQPEVGYRRRKKTQLQDGQTAKLYGYRFYDYSIIEKGQVPTRRCSWHDFFNYIVWLHFPRSKWALHRLGFETAKNHHDEGRAPLHDIITRLDEGGMAVFPTGVVDSVQCQLVLRHGTDVEKIQLLEKGALVPFVFGHALYETYLRGFLDVTAMTVFVDHTLLPLGMNASMVNPSMINSSADAALAQAIENKVIAIDAGRGGLSIKLLHHCPNGQ